MSKDTAKFFADEWNGHGFEKGDTQKFWLTFLRDVFAVDKPEKIINFEIPVPFHRRLYSEHKNFNRAKKVSAKTSTESQSDGEFLMPFGAQASRAIEKRLSGKREQNRNERYRICRETIMISYCQKFSLWYTSRCSQRNGGNEKTGGKDNEEIFQRERGVARVEHGTFQRVACRRIDFFLRSRQNLLSLASEKFLAKEAHNHEKLQRRCPRGEHGNFCLLSGSRFGIRLRHR